MAESTVVFILILGVLVAFHEFGHFIVAKLSGMKVEEFAFGFGPRLVRLFKHQETEYTIHAVPLGGFVKITGMEPGEEDIPDGFQSKPIWKRALVIFAGPLFSFILALLAFEFIGIFWGFPDGSNTLNRVLMVDAQSEAARMGLRAGDAILEINGQKVTTGTEMIDIIHARPGKQVSLLVERGDHKSTYSGVPRWSIHYLGALWSFMKGDQAVAKSVAKESTAAKAGIKQDDVLVSFNGKPVAGGAELDAAIRENGTREATLTLSRDKQVVTVSVKPELMTVNLADAEWYFPGAIAAKVTKQSQNGAIKVGDQLLKVNGEKITKGEQLVAMAGKSAKLDIEIKRPRTERGVRLEVAPQQVTSAVSESFGLLGFTPQFAFTKMGFVDSIKEGWNETRELILMVFASLAPEKIGSSVGGPILIARQTSIVVTLGPYYVVRLGAMLSLSLAIINLFPIPIFDGGHLVLLGVEAIRRRRLTREQMQWVQMAGLAIIGVLILVIFFSDITKIIGGQLPQ